MNLAIAGLEVAGLVIGIVEALKGFGVKSTIAKRASALGSGVILTFISYGIHEQLIPMHIVPYINWGVYSVAGGLAAMGYYDFGKRTIESLNK